MTEYVPTLEYPTGNRATETLIVCRSEQHRRDVWKALQLDARYILWGAMIGGRPFKKIIVFKYDDGASITQREAALGWVNESLRTHLWPEGEIHII